MGATSHLWIISESFRLAAIFSMQSNTIINS